MKVVKKIVFALFAAFAVAIFHKAFGTTVTVNAFITGYLISKMD